MLALPANLLLAPGRPDRSSASVLVQNEVSIVLDSNECRPVTIWSISVSMPSSLAILIAAEEVQSATLPTTLNEEKLDLLDTEIVIALHYGALCVAGLLVGALPSAAVIVVDDELTVVLHTELDGAIFTEDAHADYEPVTVFKSAFAILSD
ncbi:hypothetical protein FLAG1_09304 [Fusarium langsethiae]|uniref:Uncharacterized protein n=1 Tax=Fusarium langsethiae TaxID=179993 RepID=A0A0M9EQL3_FUSLA|nr:hypothetical protein FLAG1_09304 [Fusarium langsethiae]GKU06210.1 unnamed protein product [Fusarium langsethiae]GKU21911.1 unnamed protein product [Fusarium langsethiae]